MIRRSSKRTFYFLFFSMNVYMEYKTPITGVYQNVFYGASREKDKALKIHVNFHIWFWVSYAMKVKIACLAAISF